MHARTKDGLKLTVEVSFDYLIEWQDVGRMVSLFYNIGDAADVAQTYNRWVRLVGVGLGWLGLGRVCSCVSSAASLCFRERLSPDRSTRASPRKQGGAS